MNIVIPQLTLHLVATLSAPVDDPLPAWAAEEVDAVELDFAVEVELE
jgi:hypothetical protein